MGQALYRKYRSKSLDEVVGQSHVTDILKRALTKDNVAHAYLLTGPRGVGKTSIARILAHEINGLAYTDESTHLDIIEIDAASNNSVEDIRSLREKVLIAPSSAKKKIYIIDEVHMLSKSAFNALLKTLEEPPEHVVFILATTDAEKLPATIISRVQRFNFRSISEHDLQSHLRTIADAEGIDINDEALALISRHGNGSFRDSISLLDQLRNAADGTITPEHIEQALGLASSDAINQLIAAQQSGDVPAIIKILDELDARGTPAAVTCDQLIGAIHERVIEQPGLLLLLNDLLEVPRSTWPKIKLLVALTKNAAIQPLSRTSANQAPTPSEPAPKKVATPKRVEASDSDSTKEESLPSTKSVALEATKSSEISHPAPSQPFAWEAFLELIKEEAPGAYSILVKCDYTFDGTILTIYAGKKFAKVQLDKALPKLAATLQTFNDDAIIEVLAIPKPPEDSLTAAVLDIMGGGEEVKL